MAVGVGPEHSTSNRLDHAPIEATGDRSFEEAVLPHLDAAYRLARWLMRNDHDAEDVVQDAALRAFRYFRTFAGGNGRAWFLRIVRNVANSWHGRLSQASTDVFDEEEHSAALPGVDPEMLLLHTDGVMLVEHALQNLPERYREMLVLRELEGLSYREVADVMEIPIGTVMSGLSRARRAFRRAFEMEMESVAITGGAYGPPLPSDGSNQSTSLRPVRIGC